MYAHYLIILSEESDGLFYKVIPKLKSNLNFFPWKAQAEILLHLSAKLTLETILYVFAG